MKLPVTAALVCAFAMPTLADELTIERLEAGPSLNGASIQGLQLSPDGKRITFLRGKEDSPSKLDVWQFDTTSGEAKLFVDSDEILAGNVEVLSEEEKARRERNRSLTGKSGIVSYIWRADSNALAFPIGGDIYIKFLDGGVKRLTDTPEFETDVRFSPKGTYVSFIRERELYAIDVESGNEIKLTSGASETIANGVAEFVAQEELSRYTGYWWSPDETRIAYEQFDESNVLVKDRYEVQADGSVVTLKQRYPEAGSNNVEWKLGVVALDEGLKTKWVRVPHDIDNPAEPTYLARLNWSKDSQYFTFQNLYRDQQTINYAIRDRNGNVVNMGGSNAAGFQDSSDVWVNLRKDFQYLSDGSILLTLEGRDGFNHIYMMASDGGLGSQITSGDWVVNQIEKVDEESGTVYFTGFKDTPLEQHLYSVSLAGGEIKRITKESGWHSVTVGDGFFVDKFSNPTTPPQLLVKSLKTGAVEATILENKLDKTHPYYPYAKTAAKQEFGTIKANDGTPLYYRLYLPPTLEQGKQYPAIMAPYGGPHGQRVKHEWKVDFNEILARNGYVVMVLDNRGMWNRGLAFEGHVKNAMGTVEVEDQVSGVNYLKSLGYVDGDNVGIWGWSYGGYMTLMSLFKEADVFKAGVSVAPVTDWRLYDTAYTERYLGHPDAPGDVYKKSSVFEHLDGYKGGLLLIHGMADDNVFFDHSVKLMSAMQQKGMPFELMTYPGKKHGIRGYAARTHLWNTALDFFDRKLK